MLTKLLKFICRPVNVHDRYSPPFYHSPVFALLTLGSLVLFQRLTSFSSQELPTFGWVLLGLVGLMISLMAGFIPYVLVKLHERWGYASVQCTVLSLCLVLILSLWANPNKDVTPLSTFFEVAGVVATLSLFLWPVMKLLGTPPDTSKEAREELVIHNAVGALLRRGEITMQEAVVANPWEDTAPALGIRLQNLPIQARWSIAREIEIERSIQQNMRKSDSRRRRRII